MAEDIKRLNYFKYQFLREDDFNLEQGYHLQHQRDHARLLHTPGIAEGLTIPDPAAGATAVTINAGVAYDGSGRRIVLADNYPLELKDLPDDQTVYVTITYHEAQTDPTDETGITGNTRWTEAPLIETSQNAPTNPSEKLVLARIERSGKVVSNIDRSERRTAGVKGGDLDVRALTFTSESIAPGKWVKAQLVESDPTNHVVSLRVNGNLVVDGTIQGNIAVNTIETGDLVDNAVTSAKLAEADGTSGQDSNTGSGVKTGHIQDGAVTLQKLATTVQPIVSIEGVSNAGGNIDLVAGGTITIAGDNVNKRITIGETHSATTGNPHGTTAAQVGALTSETHSAITGNPHGTTAAQVGALTSVEGVSNAGGNIDLVAGGTITIAGDNVNKRITIGETHSATTGNPHGTTAAQVGALTSETHSAITGNPHGTTAAQVGALPSTGGTVEGSTNFYPYQNSTNPQIPPDNVYSHVGIGWYGGDDPTTGVRKEIMLGVWAPQNPSERVVFDGIFVYHYGGNTNYGLRINSGKAYFAGGKEGFVTDRFINASGSTLHAGDIVKLKPTGSVRFHGDMNSIPICEVTLADEDDDPLVIGIVDTEALPLFGSPDMRDNPTDIFSIPDGGELMVVTLGAYARCKVDASKDPIRVGDLLTTSATVGHAKKATQPKIGSIIGKALEPLDSGTGYIAVFVNIQ